MKHQIRFTHGAIHDIEGIWNYIAMQGENPNAADELILEFNQVLNQTASFPELGQRYHLLQERGVRQIQIRKRYVIFYEPIDNGIVVLRIRHSSELIAPEDFTDLN